MLYEGQLTIPANISKLSPVTHDIVMVPGQVNLIHILFPPGCAGLAGLRIFEKSKQLWPSSPDVWLIGDTAPVVFPEDYMVREEPYTFTLTGYNEDTLYEHTITVYISLLGGTEGWQQQLAKLFGLRPITGVQ
jgi:hypothetical protein